jgi:NAD(P)-dependent dehydrogenase (short-subunit alcohol dehydrogenase family)
MSQPFANQTALVTGAGSGMGRAIAIELARGGAVVYLLARTAATLSQTQQQAPKSIPIPADLTNDDDIKSVTHTITKLDILVHCAATFARGPIESAPVAELDSQYRTNVRGPYLLTQSLLPVIKSAMGQIVFVNSTAGLNAAAQIGAYSASKHALKAVADALRDELNASGVRVMSVFPGRTDSPMQREVHRLEGKHYDPTKLMQPQDVADVVISALALPRTAEVVNLTMRQMHKV